MLVEVCRGYYNHHRPHSALGYQTLAEEFAVAVDFDRRVEDAGQSE